MSISTIHYIIFPLTNLVILLLIIFFIYRRSGRKSSQDNSWDEAPMPRNTDPGRTSEGVGNSKTFTADSPYIKVYVSKSGDIILDGRVTTLDEVRSACSALAQQNGIFLYSRDNPEEYEGHPNGVKVINLAMENSLPIRLCQNKDFSDVIGPDGKLWFLK